MPYFAKIIGAKINALRKDHGMSQLELAEHAGIKAQQLSRYERGLQMPGDEALGRIASALGTDLASLATSSFGTDSSSTIKVEIEKDNCLYELNMSRPQVRVIGLAECGLSGWQIPTVTSTYTTVPFDVYREGRGYAVLAIGDSMIPAGVQPGFLVLVDPDLKPMPGDIVFVEDSDGHGTIKNYIGPTKVGHADFVALQGWLPKDPKNPDAPQKPFTMELPKSSVKTMHPALYVKRRM